MARVLIHLTRGPEDPTVAALALLVARTAAAEGHEVGVFLAGEATLLARDAVRASAVGVGTGSVQEHLDALVDHGAVIWLSGMSSAARGIVESDLVPLGAHFAQPDVLVRESLACDRVLTY